MSVSDLFVDPTRKKLEINSLKFSNRFANNDGRYAYTDFLGSGSFGVVLRARDVEVGHDVAIKLVKCRGLTFLEIIMGWEPQDLRNAEEEARTLKQLKHENIVKLKEHFIFSGDALKQLRGLVIVMELCPNGSLQTHLERNVQPIGLDQRKKWYTQLSSAVQYIHSQHIVHLDIKPDNILLDKYKNLKIADVGLATSLLKKNTKIQLHMYLSQQKGTKPYMAPEVFKGRYNMRCDIFSLGLVFVMIANDTSSRSIWGWSKVIPLTKDKGYLGNTDYYSQIAKPTSLLDVSLNHLSEKEVELFDGMLKCYWLRSSIDCVLQSIESIGKKRPPRSRTPGPSRSKRPPAN